MGLFGGDDKQIEHGAVDSIIGGKAKFKGEIVSSGAISINGEFEGKLSAKGEVIIGRGSRVVGSVNGGSVVVSGKVEGNIAAAENLEISKSGRVHGDLVGGRITIEEGSSYRGRVRVESGAKEEEVEEEIIQEEPEASAPQETTQAPMF